MAITEADPLTYTLIGLAMQVHRRLGPGLDEICYHELLSAELSTTPFAHEFKPRRELVHRGFLADVFEADIVIPDRAVLEAKHLREGFVPKHFAQLHCYLKAWKIQTGLLIDFGKQSLLFRRQIAPTTPPTVPSREELDRHLQSRGLDRTDAELVAACLDRVLQEHGLGYWDTTYHGLVHADLRAENLDVIDRPEVHVHTGCRRTRNVRLDCLVVERSLAIQILALQQSIPAAAQAIMTTCLRLLRLHTGITVNFGKHHVDLYVQLR